MRKYDLLAICLLVFAGVLSACLGVWEPMNTTALKDWQPLIAAFVAFGAATLAYSAAMAKVRYDERTARQAELRRVLGIFLRFDFAVDVVRHEAKYFSALTKPPASISENSIVRVDDLAFTDTPDIRDAWSNLDYFPVELSRRFYALRNEIYNFEDFKKDHVGEEYRCEYGMTPQEELVDLHAIFVALTEFSVNAVEEARAEIAKLRAKMT
jgi:hypothetical protein